ncbi:MAG: HEAT repeat domain-containing protein [Planctomycetes bacterium]|nr:HEAT repeat domain-containing protein [Planctomycetota bacterium]
MRQTRDIFKVIINLPDPSVDQALADALATAEPDDTTRIVATLLQRRRPQGLVPMILHFHQLPQDAQSDILTHATDLSHSLREAMAADNGRGASNVIQIITRARAAKLAYLLSDQLRHGPAELRPLAAKGLLELAESAPTNQPQVMEAIQSAVREALISFKVHGQTGVLLALAALAPRDMAAAVSIIEDRNHAALEPMRRLITIELPPEIRRGLLAWATVKQFTPAAVTGLDRACGAGHLGDVLAGAHLLAHGQAALAVRKLLMPRQALPSRESIAVMPPERLHWLPAWITALQLEPAQRIDALASLHTAPDPATRLAALRRLLDLAYRAPGMPATSGVPLATIAAVTARSDIAVARFCGDEDPAIARIAVRHLVGRRWPGLTKLLLQLVKSPHEEIRRLAGAHLAPLGFTHLWDAWPRLNFAQQIAGGTALIKLDPAFHRMLGEKLATPLRATRLRTISIIQTLNQTEFFVAPMVALTAENDEIVASAAVKALGAVDKPESITALNKALTHHDARVRANAVESLHQLKHRDHEERLLEMAREEANRPRANAIGALMDMRTAEALSSLVKMLADPQPAQRASALWLVDHMGLIEVARHVAELAVADPDYEIKSRASGVIHRLIDSLRPNGKPAGDAEPRPKAG